jgi:uncharacterized alkaline shock family protein YloU
MTVYGLSGLSGTGKSFRAATLATEYACDGIIDDGLLISVENRNIVSGSSAKLSETKIGAVRIALFEAEDRAKEMREAIKSSKFKRILIVGTSHRMVEKIAKKLELPEPTKIVDITEITTQKERIKARKERMQKGAHIVPVPSVKIQKTFAGYFILPLKNIISFRNQQKHPEAIKNTIVRPTYSLLGNFYISSGVIRKIIEKSILTDFFEGKKISVSENENSISVFLTLKIRSSGEIFTNAENQQRIIKSTIIKMTSKTVEKVNIVIV